ncbi:MAG TPA: cytochrome C551 [Clostridiales bacterium]|nr:cytochrome C551 [Clostridiales bacterium]
MADKVLKCKDCSSEFIFSDGEQTFYKEKGFENEPQRCPDCRRARKQQRPSNKGGNSYFR